MAKSQENPGSVPVERRHVLYISGFDPRGPQFYHSTFQQEAAKRVKWHGGSIDVGPARRQGRLSTVWPITAEIDGKTTETTYEFLRWDDIMREHIQANRKRFLAELVSTYWRYVSTGTLWRILKIGYPPFITGVYPIVFLLAQIIGFICLALLLTWIAVSVLNVPLWSAVIIFGLVGWAGWVFAFWLEKRVPYMWPVHVYNFAAAREQGSVSGFEDRLDKLAVRVGEVAGSSDAHEILVISHSNGPSVAISIIARALELDPKLGQHGPSVSFLTLGHSILLDSLLPGAGQLRADMQTVADDNGVNWIDITAPRDGACFALVDPLLESGLPAAIHNNEPKPKRLSIPMTDLFSSQTWKKELHRHWLRIHFQYLMAYEKSTPYDFFEMTCGPQRLIDRFASFASKPGFDKFKLFGKSASARRRS